MTPPLRNPQSPIRILVVDDEPSVRRVISRYLTAEGYDCAQAASGEEAWQALQEGNFSLLLTDIMMPGMSGIELLTKTREQLPDVAVIVITAVDDRATAVHSLEIGAYGYMIKSLDENEVLIGVANALERRRLMQLSLQYEQRLEKEVHEKTSEIRRTQEEITLRLVRVSEHRDNETGAHIRRMALYAAVLAEEAGWDSEAVHTIRLAAPMHDIGKVGVPDDILLKPGRLTDEEFQIMQRHAALGASMLEGSGVPLLEMAKEIALSHHEKWDGSGYPRGLAGEAIPESARIVAVADVYDALVSRRVYRPAMPQDKALAIIQEGKGKHFDPKVFESFMRVRHKLRDIREQANE